MNSINNNTHLATFYITAMNFQDKIVGSKMIWKCSKRCYQLMTNHVRYTDKLIIIKYFNLILVLR